MNIKLVNAEYNAVYGLLASFEGPAGAVVTSSKLIDQMRGKVDNGNAESIELEVEPYQLESVLEGVKAIVEAGKIKATDIDALTSICGLIKLRKAFGSFLDAFVAPKESTIEIDTSVDLDVD